MNFSDLYKLTLKVHESPDKTTAVESGLRELCRILDQDSAYIFEIDNNDKRILSSAIWCSERITNFPPPPDQDGYSMDVLSDRWWDDMRSKGAFQVDDVEEVLEHSPHLYDIFKSFSLRRLVDLPLLHDGQVIGFIGLSSTQSGSGIGSSLFPALKVFGATLLGVLKEQRAREREHTWQSSFSMFMDQTSDAIFSFQYNSPISIKLDVDSQVDMIYDAKLIMANDVMAQSYGYSKANEVIGLSFMDLVHERSESLDTVFRTFVENDYRTYGARSEEVTAQGIRYFMNNAQGVVVDGMLLSVWGSFSDVTQLVEMERELESSRRFQAIGQVASGITHDYRNLLAIVEGNLELYCLENQSARSELQKVFRTLERAKRLSHMTLRPGQESVENIDLYAFVRGITEQLSSCSEIETQFKLDFPINASILFNSIHLDQVLSNLYNNALEAMNSSGVITTGVKYVRHECGSSTHLNEGSQDFLCLYVSDNGPGIGPDQLNSMFEPFFTTKEHGTGLGLSGVRRLLGLYQCQIRPVLSVPGLRFEILIPLSRCRELDTPKAL